MFSDYKEQHEFMTDIIRSEGEEVPREQWPPILPRTERVDGKTVTLTTLPPEKLEQLEKKRARIFRVLRWNSCYWVDDQSMGLSCAYESLEELLDWEPMYDEEEEEDDDSLRFEEFCVSLSSAIESGHGVYYREFDGGSPAHGGSSEITRWGDTYWASDAYDGVVGPCSDIADALNCVPVMALVSGEGTYFSSSELTAEQIAQHLWMGNPQEVSFRINGMPWRSVIDDGKVRFEPDPDGAEEEDEESEEEEGD